MKNLIYILSSIILLSSCFKEEDKRAINNEASVSIPLGEDYGDVFYYNLSNQSIVAENKWADWNLAFYAQEDNYFIRLNDAANMKAFAVDRSLPFEEINQIADESKSIIDDPKGSLDNLALNYEVTETKGDSTFYTDATYILLIGTNALGEKIGYKKVKLLYTYLNQYVFRHANLDGSEDYISTVRKDVTLNYVFFSFNNEGETVTIEPDKTTWDLVFTRSTDMTVTNDFVDTIFDYSVTSVLLNPYFTEAYKEETVNYDECASIDIIKTNFTNQRNIIGYNWKGFDLQNGTYAIRQDEFYVVKDINDFYYKVKFLSFNDPNTNIKGTISFKYEIIK